MCEAGHKNSRKVIVRNIQEVVGCARLKTINEITTYNHCEQKQEASS